MDPRSPENYTETTDLRPAIALTIAFYLGAVGLGMFAIQGLIKKNFIEAVSAGAMAICDAKIATTLTQAVLSQRK